MAKVLPLGLLTSTTVSYDQTKTTLQGRASQRTITDGNGAKSVLGPSPIIMADVFDDTGVAPVGLHCTTQNGRVFIGKGFAAGVWTVSCYTVNLTTGVLSWVGDLKLSHTNTGAYTLRGFSVDDTTPSSMIFTWVVTNTTVQQGGWYASFGVDIADFHTTSFVTYPVATLASTNKTVYQIGDTALQATHTVTVADGIDQNGSSVYILNGAAATPKVFKLDNTVPTTAPVAGYSIANGTIVVTAVLPALSGTVLLVNNVKIGTIGHGANSGFAVLTFLTTTTIYTAKLTDVTNAAATLPSLTNSNMALGADIVTITASLGQYSSFLDKFVIVGTAGNTIIKQAVSNDSNGKIISSSNQIKTETVLGGTITPGDFAGPTNLCCTMMAGWAVVTGTTVGARGFTAIDLYSDESSKTSGEINTSVISPVISGNFSQAIMLATFYELAKRSVKATVQYRTSGFATGPSAGFDATWTTAPKDGDLSALVNATQVQFRLLFSVMAMETTNSPQISEAYLIYTDLTQISENWAGSVDNTTQAGASPARTAFRLKTAYATVVPTLYFRAYDDSNTLVASANTVTNPTLFEYTTNNGTSWNPLGTIPNTALTTEVRYNWVSPPGVRVTASIRES